MSAIRSLANAVAVLLGTLVVGVTGLPPDPDDAPGWPDQDNVQIWPDLTQVALIILASCLFVANLGGIWWLALSLGWR